MNIENKNIVEQFTKEQAVEFYESKKWENMSFVEIARFQIKQDRLCMPFEVFHEAVEKTLGRPVFTHEFGLMRESLENQIFEKSNSCEKEK